MQNSKWKLNTQAGRSPPLSIRHVTQYGRMKQSESPPRRATDPLVIAGRSYPAATVVRLLGPFISDERKERIESVLEQRTRSVIPVIEGVHDLGNIGAVIRSAEGLGCQELHLIDRAEKYKKSRRTSQGAEKWIELNRWADSTACVRHLKDRGYTVLVTHPDDGKPLDTFDFDQPTALVFGNEAEGVSEDVLSLADDRCYIPMAGFAQSFNVSVAAAVVLYHVYRRRVERRGASGDLSDEDKNALRALYYSRSVQAAGQILKGLTGKQT